MPRRKPATPATQAATKDAQRAAVAAAEAAAANMVGTLEQLEATSDLLGDQLARLVQAMRLAGLSELESWAMIDDAAARIRPPA